MDPSQNIRLITRFLSLVAVLFGIVTIIAGTRALTGSDPGYNVYLPLLIYNTTMGLAYIATGITIWHSLKRGKYAAAVIFVLNLLVLGTIAYLYMVGSSIAVESMGAMIFRTVIWFSLFISLVWMSRRRTLTREQLS